MTSPQAEAYAAEQQAAVAAVVAAAGTAAALAGFQLANFTVFMRFLRLIWPAVVQGRRRAAWSARNFFDLERARVTGLPQLDVPLLPDYRFEFFVNDMRPAYNLAVKQIRVVRELERQGVPAPAPKIESTVRVAVAKVVADAGREEMIQAVQTDAERAKNLQETKKEAAKAARRLRKTWGGNYVKDTSVINIDDEPHPDVVGWARVATGNETCAWCLMLVSRAAADGPILYWDSDTAGSKLTTTEYLNKFGRTNAEILATIEDGVKVPMNDWHTGCDCMVVPIFDKNDWIGKQAAEDAWEQWKAAGEDFLYDPDKKYRFGSQDKDGKWTFTSSTVTEGVARYRETLNNLRFMLEGRSPADRQRVSKDQLDEILRGVPGAAKLFQKELARR